MVDSEPERGQRALDRLIFFSDAVFAIAMTLLVLDIPRPGPHQDVAAFLTTLDGKFIAYVISFWVIALYWLAHHRLFRVVTRFDQGVLMLNLVLLFFVAFLPYPSAILGDHGGDVGATIFYAVCISAVGAASTMLGWYVVMHRRFTVPITRRVARYYVYRGGVVPVVFLASVPVARVDVPLAQRMWILPFVVQVVAGRVVRYREARDEAATAT